LRRLAIPANKGIVANSIIHTTMREAVDMNETEILNSATHDKNELEYNHIDYFKISIANSFQLLQFL